MDDLTSKISEILSDPGALEQIKGLAGMFGASPPQSVPPEKEVHNTANDSFIPKDQSDMLNMAMKILPLINAYKRDDSTTQLLHALKPFLSESRQKKLVEALKILQIMRLLPLIQQTLPGLNLF